MSAQGTLLDARKPFPGAEPVKGGETGQGHEKLFPEGLISKAFSVILKDL